MQIFTLRSIFFIFIVVLVGMSCGNDNLRKLSEDDLIERIANRQLPNPQDVVIKNDAGQILSMQDLVAYEHTGKYFQDFYVDSKGDIVEIVARPKTAEDEKLIERIKERLRQPPKLKKVEIDCSDKVNILQNLFDRDQELRKPGRQIDANVDFENLEIVVSFIEQCGMPTLEEVNDVQMAGIWAVLQHAPAFYQKKYIPLLEKSAENGDIKWGTIVMMKDRALMDDGEPQMYGTQIKNGELYDLFEPEYVNQRRAEIGMEPIEEYLKRFNVEFDIEQKIK